jgi:hypothetical protein
MSFVMQFMALLLCFVAAAVFTVATGAVLAWWVIEGICRRGLPQKRTLARGLCDVGGAGLVLALGWLFWFFTSLFNPRLFD